MKEQRYAVVLACGGEDDLLVETKATDEPNAVLAAVCELMKSFGIEESAPAVARSLQSARVSKVMRMEPHASSRSARRVPRPARRASSSRSRAIATVRG